MNEKKSSIMTDSHPWICLFFCVAYMTPKDRFGATPLDDAIREGQSDIMIYLRAWTNNTFGNPEYI